MRKMPQYSEVLDKISETSQWYESEGYININSNVNINGTLSLAEPPFVQDNYFKTYEQGVFSISVPNAYYSLPNSAIPDANYPITFILHHSAGGETVVTMKYDPNGRIFLWSDTSSASSTNVGDWFDRLDWNYSPVRGATGYKFRFTFNQQFILDNDVQQVTAIYAKAGPNSLPVNYYKSL